MCGILGFSWKDAQLARRMGQVLSHRGPDQHGVYVDQNVSLGHQRLSIIDLSEKGRQPMTNEDGTVWVTYNGEIYNFRELREFLEGKGHRFRSHCDTEVIVHAYEEFGLECVRHFNGMFAFAIWDAKSQQLFLARDRLGIKPLYYYHKGKKFLFASEIKAILQDPEVDRSLNIQSLVHYVGFEFVPSPGTMFQDIQKLPAGHYLVYRDGKTTVREYWDLRFTQTKKDPKEYEEQLLDLLASSVRKRLISDVPLGVFLSGGLDSSAVVALMHQCGIVPLQTFALGYDDPSFSELEYAKIMAESVHSQHRELIIDPISPSLIEKAAWHLDEPMTDLSTISFYLICQKAKQFATVCLSGEGGDEVLAGYDRFKASKAHGFYDFIPEWIRRGVVAPLVNALPDQSQKKGAINILKRFIQGGLLPKDGGHMRWQYFGQSIQEEGLLQEGYQQAVNLDPFAPIRSFRARCNSEDSLDQELYVDLKFTMSESVLMKVDKMSMANSLEVRVPFLDHEFVEFCGTIPSSLKLDGFKTKAIFRSAMKDVLPERIRHRGKQGYSLPIKNWLRQELKEYMTDTLHDSVLIRNVFKPSEVDRIIAEHLTYSHNRNHELWAMLNLAVWHKLFIEDQVTNYAI
ncbi:MAG: asparagine synthase (glutamine-hydrolyzing) [Nitrospirae bacterium]|nr:asparagine synthase (glutamine-hydrolyzing) [Nitrospirota bacterium]